MEEKRIMRRLLATTGAAALAAGAFAAPAAAETLTVVEVLTSPPRTELLQQMLDSFQEQHPDVEIELISVPWDTAFEKVLTMTQSGQEIDVLEMPERWISTLDATDSLVDLGPYIEDWDGADQMTEATLGYTRIFDDTPYFMPYGYFVRALYYNKALLAEAGIDAPPETLQEFVDQSRQVTEELDGKFGYCLRGARGGFVGWWLFVSGMTGSTTWWDEEGNSIFDTPEGTEGLKMLIDLYQDGYAPPDSVNWAFNEQVAGFYSRTCAFLDQDPDALIQIAERMGDDEFAVAPVPLGPEGTIAPPVGIIGWSVGTSSSEPDLAWDLVAHLSQPENNIEWAKFIGVIPAVKGAEDDPFYSGDNYAGFFTELNDDRWQLRPWPAHLPELGQFFDVLSVETGQAALLGEMTAEELAETWDEFLTEAQQNWMAEQ